MNRAIKVQKIDNSIYRWYGRNLEGADMAFLSVVGFILTGIPAIFLSIGISVLFSLLALPLTLFIVGGIAWVVNSEPMDDRPYERTLYQLAHQSYQEITSKHDREDAKTLLDNLYAHELGYSKMNKKHKTKYECETCYRRSVLISEMKEDQVLPGTDDDDIKAIEMKREIRKELTA